jgi:hypothetical protein
MLSRMLIAPKETNTPSDETIKAVEQVFIKLEELRKAYAQLESVSTSDKCKQRCLSEMASHYTSKNLITYAIEAEGLMIQS